MFLLFLFLFLFLFFVVVVLVLCCCCCCSCSCSCFVVVVVDDDDYDDVVVDPGHIFETKNVNKNTVFSDIFMPLYRRKKHWVLRRFCGVKGENRPKTSLFTLCFLANA